MTTDKARRNAYDVWKEFDDRMKIAEKNVVKVESKLSEYNDKLYQSTRNTIKVQNFISCGRSG